MYTHCQYLYNYLLFSIAPLPPHTRTQHPLLQGAMIYPGKDSAWQPVVTTLPALMTEVPKESIIANTDFTITSGLAKRYGTRASCDVMHAVMSCML